MYLQNQNKLKMILNALKSNWKFYIIYNLIFLIIGIITGSAIQSLITGLIIQIHAYYVHILAHKLPYFNKIHLLHHTKIINKYWYNILMEAIQNILLEGGFWVIASVILGLGIKIFNETYKLNVVTMLLWMLLYASVHLINYRLVHPNSHIAHHMDYYKNLSLTDMFDLIFDTKYDKKNIQNLNHFIINVVIITTLLYFWY